MALGILTSCFSRTYVIGKNPAMEDITGVYASAGGMEMTSCWSYSAIKSTSGNRYTLQRTWWDEDERGIVEKNTEISESDFNKITASLEGLEYVKYRTSSEVMDGYSESVRLSWPKSPSGSYKVDFGEKGMRECVAAFLEVWKANAYKDNDPVDVSNIREFEFSFGPTDIAGGDEMFSISINEEGKTILSHKESESFETVQTEVTDEILQKTGELLRKHGADRWNGFSGENSLVLDGSAFYLSVITEEGLEIIASGLETYPDGFHAFRNELKEMFMKYFE